MTANSIESRLPRTTVAMLPTTLSKSVAKLVADAAVSVTYRRVTVSTASCPALAIVQVVRAQPEAVRYGARAWGHRSAIERDERSRATRGDPRTRDRARHRDGCRRRQPAGGRTGGGRGRGTGGSGGAGNRVPRDRPRRQPAGGGDRRCRRRRHRPRPRVDTAAFGLAGAHATGREGDGRQSRRDPPGCVRRHVSRPDRSWDRVDEAGGHADVARLPDQ